MRVAMTLCSAIVIILIAGCSSPQKRTQQAESRTSEERLRLVEQYKDCVNKAGEDKQKVEACDSHLKAAEALK